MEEFAILIKALDTTNKTTVKVAALAEYFRKAPNPDKVWAIALLSQRRPPRPVNTTMLRSFAAELAAIPLWLFEESYHIVGDLAETISLVVPSGSGSSEKSLAQFLEEIIALKGFRDEEKKKYLHENWLALNYYERFVFTKLITGSFRIGVSQKLMTRALSVATEIDEDILAYRLMGNWDPGSVSFSALVLEEHKKDFLSKPYPFYLAYALEGAPNDLGDPGAWSAEHKWDGIRAQAVIRGGSIFLWSRGEELVTDKFPEFSILPQVLPEGIVLDGEILALTGGEIGSFNELQKRMGRKQVSKSLLQKSPVFLKVYDILEWEGKDIRKLPFSERRSLLEDLLRELNDKQVPLQLSPSINFASWEQAATHREQARAQKSEGLMLKRWDSPYLSGRKKGDWWKWKVDPFTIDAVLTYAMRGHGRRSNLFTDYTFGLWDRGELVTFAKAYSGLTDAEFRQVDAFIKKNTLERFGPVRSVKPTLVFEIAFEGIAVSGRHKSGVATRFPRIHRWRHDKKVEEANTLDELKAMIP